MYILTDIMRIRLTENRLRQIIKEGIKDVLNEQILYHSTEERGMIKNQNGIWLSAYPETDYGDIVYEFDVRGLNIADFNTVLNFVKKYDLRNFDEVTDDEFMGETDNVWDLWQQIKAGKLSKEEAYEKIGYYSWNGVLEHPYSYKFPSKLKAAGYDGYMFEYYCGYLNDYYYIFDPNKCKLIGEYEGDEDDFDEDDDF